MLTTQFVTFAATIIHRLPAKRLMSRRALATLTALSGLISVLRATPLQAAQPTRFATEPTRASDSTPVAVHAREVSGHALALPFALAADVRLRAPGTSRFAGEYVGAASVDSLLAALCNSSVGTVAGIQHFTADSTRGALLVLRSVRAGDRRLAWHEVIVYRLDDARRMRAIDLYVENQRAWDRRYPREDGVSRMSLATKRNVARARARMRHARFVAGNGDGVLAVLDGVAIPEGSAARPGRIGIPQTTLVQHSFAPSGEVRRTITYTATEHATLAGAVAR